jgi:acetyl esterase
MGSVVQNEPAIRTLAHLSGWTVAAPSYRLAPEHPYPAGLEDSKAALYFLQHNAEELGLDRRRMALGGASAGANLALATALFEERAQRFRWNVDDPLLEIFRPDGTPVDGVGKRSAHASIRPIQGITALILFYGVYGADLDTASHREFGGDEFGLPRARMAQFFDWYDPNGARHRDPLIQPLLAPYFALPPTFLLAAGLDPLLDDTLRLHERLTAEAVTTALRVEPGAVHGFINRGRMVRAARDSLAEAARFLRELP